LTTPLIFPNSLAAPFDTSRLQRKVYLHGPAGAGKSTYAAQQLGQLLATGGPPDRILVLVPQVTVGRLYQLQAQAAPAGGAVNILTFAGLARRYVELYWPSVAAGIGFANPTAEPTFLNVETAQYLMARLASTAINENQFVGVSLPATRIVSQVLDNLNRAALLGWPIEAVARRLTETTARDSNRPKAYAAAQALAEGFRAHCLANNLLDYSLLTEAFLRHLLPDPAFTEALYASVDHLIADNIEENTPAAHDLIAGLLPHLQSALIIQDDDGGFRNFLGADPDNASELSAGCEVLYAGHSQINQPPISALGAAFHRHLSGNLDLGYLRQHEATDYGPAYEVGFYRFYPQMIDWAVERALQLVQAGVPPKEIAILSPFLSDSLRFTLSYKLRARANALGLPLNTLSHRPSRALRDDPAARAMLTLVALANPHIALPPPLEDVTDMLTQVIDGLDPVRANLLARIAYKPRSKDGANPLQPFANIKPDMQTRITYRAGERYDSLRDWLGSYRAQLAHEGQMPLDFFMRRLFGEVLSQPGYGFHRQLEAGRVIAQLANSAAQFRRALYPQANADWAVAGGEYMQLVYLRLLPALYAQNWQDEEADAIFMAPASTFLLRNRYVSHQFWLDIGSPNWGERLDQPLTHPYVLKRGYPASQVWSDTEEREVQQSALYRTAIGLARRCREKIYLGIADLSEGGYEQRGDLLIALNKIMRKNPPAHFENSSLQPTEGA
jgi:hypothetical protein